MLRVGKLVRWSVRGLAKVWPVVSAAACLIMGSIA